MLLALSLFLLTIPAAASSPAGVPAAQLPETPSGRKVAAFLEAFNASDEAALARFFAENVAAEGLRQRPAEERARRIAGLRQRTGRIAVRRADPRPPASLALIVEGNDRQLLRLAFDFEAQPPHRLVGILVDDASPEDLAGPPPPMAEAEALAAVAKAADEAAASDLFSGVILVARDGQKLLHRAWGLANRELGVPTKIDTRFNLGSINKIFTRVAIGQLLEQGRLSLDDRIGKHLPDYPNADAAAKVTIRQLLEMQSGIGDFFGARFEATPKDRLRRNADFLPLFATDPLLFEPGKETRYSNGGYIVLGEVVSRISGQDYHDYVREHVFARAGMTDTDSFEADAIVPNLAEGYMRDSGVGSEGKAVRRRNIYSRPARGSAAGGGYATAEDLLRFGAALASDRLLTAPWTEWVLARAEPTPGRPLGDRRRGGLGIAGGAPGINAAFELDRESGWTVIVLANGDPPMATQMAQRIRRLLDAVAR